MYILGPTRRELHYYGGIFARLEGISKRGSNNSNTAEGYGSLLEYILRTGRARVGFDLILALGDRLVHITDRTSSKLFGARNQKFDPGTERILSVQYVPASEVSCVARTGP